MPCTKFQHNSVYFVVMSEMILDSTQNILQSCQKWFWLKIFCVMSEMILDSIQNILWSCQKWWIWWNYWVGGRLRQPHSTSVAAINTLQADTTHQSCGIWTVEAMNLDFMCFKILWNMPLFPVENVHVKTKPIGTKCLAKHKHFLQWILQSSHLNLRQAKFTPTPASSKVRA